MFISLGPADSLDEYKNGDTADDCAKKYSQSDKWEDSRATFIDFGATQTKAFCDETEKETDFSMCNHRAIKNCCWAERARLRQSGPHRRCVRFLRSKRSLSPELLISYESDLVFLFDESVC